jgi:hypothetical protein
MRRYKLQFDNGPDEFIDADSPTEAVAKRVNKRLPFQMTDLTAMREWLRQAGRPAYQLQEA